MAENKKRSRRSLVHQTASSSAIMRSSWSRFGVVMVAAVFEAQLASGMSAERRNLRECIGKDRGAVSGILCARCMQ